jgi:hypothetical protein
VDGSSGQMGVIECVTLSSHCRSKDLRDTNFYFGQDSRDAIVVILLAAPQFIADSPDLILLFSYSLPSVSEI